MGRLKKQIADLEAQLNDVTNKLKKTTEVKNKTERELNVSRGVLVIMVVIMHIIIQ